MRYIRFLKTPRVVTEKGTSKRQISCLITITSDLGDSFLPYDVEMAAEVLSPPPSEEVLLWRNLQWKAGMRSLPVTFPLATNCKTSSLRIRVGYGSKSKHDDYKKLSENGACGVVSAWSPEFTPSLAAGEAEKLVGRRFELSEDHVVNIYEETGESIARHLWDAGITLSCHIGRLLDCDSPKSKPLLPSGRPALLRVLELGAGCGMVGIAIAQTVAKAQVLLTDLLEAREIVECNIKHASPAQGSTLKFEKLDWDDELPLDLRTFSSCLNLVVAADCTYNPDSSPALVQTLKRLVNVSPEAVVAIAMKMRHASEEIFFDLMSEAGFLETTTLDFPLPGDIEAGEEVVYLHVYRYSPSG
ncbi:putative methyltransferase-domain-containing protein [Ampelomyces quisqualis]|uniref:Putative methyltransferase-domain-containing protein n=1 Tax=Ampelomyces quisqualis TaxID=50730 RepID=A0A6A5QHB9_AMPQU|nr:putative methyltransferase-domain-containing protein [Ampelomyces quisqualis]